LEVEVVIEKLRNVEMSGVWESSILLALDRVEM
jgi:hypothetical protein